MAKDPLKFWKSDDVEEIAEELIRQFHPHLAGETIMYLFRSTHAEANGRIVLGKAKRVTGLNAYLAASDGLEEMNADAAKDTKKRGADPKLSGPADKAEAPMIRLVEIAYDTWAHLNATQRIALVDHELSHFNADGSLRGHEIEEFRSVIERHGLWQPDLELMARSMVPFLQAELFPVVPEIGTGSVSSSVKMTGAQIASARRAIENIRPKKGSGIDSLIITVEGEEPVTLRARE